MDPARRNFDIEALAQDASTERLAEMIALAYEASAQHVSNEVKNGLVRIQSHLRTGEDVRKPLADLLFTMGCYKESAEIFEELARETEDVSEWNNYGVALSRLGDDKKAVTIYRRALKLKPNSAKVWFNLGKAFFRLRHYPESFRAFENSVTLEPENKSAWNNLGVVCRAMGQNEQAIKCYQVAAEIDPEYAWAWHNMGILFMYQGRHAEAENHFLRALESKPDYEPSKKMLEKVRRERGE
ncbi:MAG: tetratricopeptide repeat protein [Candidatus Thermoplasmatota archaeon]|nr:tetratricopeptide repeat protein [Candidatus Thermoplasmatota archaeon]